ncbi:MAG: short-chain dehydrogenase [Ignavibacteriae bacterium]|nr:short-chain dehydrogenase [Ignavibacteriota bacterium]
MDIQGKTVLIIGGWGLVGSAVCRKFMEEHPRRLIVTSLTESEAREAVTDLERLYPDAGKGFFVPWWGNIFVREELKDMPRDRILASKKYRAMIIDDMLEELSGPVLERSSLYKLLQKFKPEIVVDCVNSATGIAYQDIFQSSRRVLKEAKAVQRSRKQKPDKLVEVTEQLICTLYVPQLIRHVQLMYRSMQIAGTKIYLKIGTSGTGGMGLNIPYTHSEERPSRVLLSKSAVAGAHTLLLFLMGRTPDAPITKEIKPTAAIAWKAIGYGDITKRGRGIPLEDCPVSGAVKLGKTLKPHMPGIARARGEQLRSVFIDTGENGYFSRGEFEAISTPGQMEFVTPEEIAESTVFEIRAGNTGHDIINALDNATLAPTYRAGYMFHSALKTMRKLEQDHGVDSVAFEMLGPPRLSKLLYESYLLKVCFGDVRTVARTETSILSRRLLDLIEADDQLRSQIISIGIPILLPDGRSLVRASNIKIPPAQGQDEFPINASSIDRWAHDGWVDLREKNMKHWRQRFTQIIKEVESLPDDETSSRTMHNREYWKNLTEIDPGKVCGWIFTYEEKGKRMKA